jgi:hypothetical protein
MAASVLTFRTYWCPSSKLGKISMRNVFSCSAGKIICCRIFCKACFNDHTRWRGSCLSSAFRMIHLAFWILSGLCSRIWAACWLEFFRRQGVSHWFSCQVVCTCQLWGSQVWVCCGMWFRLHFLSFRWFLSKASFRLLIKTLEPDCCCFRAFFFRIEANSHFLVT